jgi:signal transduction histidine kinase
MIGLGDRQPYSDSLRLTRALAHDLRASVHGLRMALDMMAGTLTPGGGHSAGRYLGMAQDEAAQLERTVEQLGLWIRLLGGDLKVRLQRLDLQAVAAERLLDLDGSGQTDAVIVMADKSLMVPALEGLRDFLRAYALPRENAGVRIHTDGTMELFGPPSLLPVLQSVVENPVPDLAVAKGPAMWLVGPSLAVATCRASEGTVWLEQSEAGCALWLAWRKG